MKRYQLSTCLYKYVTILKKKKKKNREKLTFWLFTLSTHLQNRSFRIVASTRTNAKCTKTKNAWAKCANLRCSCRCCRHDSLSSLILNPILLASHTQQGWVQGWRSGESTCLPPMWPRFDSQIWGHMWVEFVGSLLCTERFSPGTLVSPLL